MLSLTTVQRLLVISALSWAIFPRWGGFAFLASWVLLAIGSANRTTRARKVLDAHGSLLGTLSPETQSLVQRFPLAYVWPSTAERWGTTWQLSGLVSLILAGVFAAWALLTFTAWYLLLLVPLAGTLVGGGAMARRIKVGDRVKEDLKELRPAHDSLTTVLALKTTIGQWPPEPSPDPEPSSR